MIKTAAIVFALLIAWPTLLKTAVFVSWQANREYIAQNFCVKRADPTSDCGGCCQLQKQIKATEETSIPFVPFKGIEKIQLGFFDVTFLNETAMPGHISAFSFNRYTQHLSISKFISSVFQPPESNVLSLW